MFAEMFGTVYQLFKPLTVCRILEREASDTVQVTSGVPQVYVLGLILFLIYINKLRNVISAGVHLFDDDAIVYCTI